MQAAPLPADEARRLAALHAMKVLDTPPEERFDRYTRLALQLIGAEMAAISLVDSDRTWFKSEQGLGLPEVARAVSFCGHAILHGGVLVVEDALKDERFSDNPLVQGAPGVRFYAGQPLRDSSGLAVGTLAVFDTRPRILDTQKLALLRDLSAVIEGELTMRSDPGRDALTGLHNRRGFDIIARHSLATAQRTERPTTLLNLDIDDYRGLVAAHGSAVAEQALVDLAGMLAERFRASDVVARMDGDSFCILCGGVGPDDLEPLTTRLDELLRQHNERTTGPQLRVSVGHALYDPQRHPSPSALVSSASAELSDRRLDR